jgi:serine/threonine-protein kinase
MQAPAPTPALTPQQRAHEEHRAHLQRAVGDQYALGSLLGRGGFAEVYAARDLRLKREVAVKTLRYDLRASDIVRERFQREAEAMAQLRHPNIIPIYSVGEHEGLAYFVMPLVKGETLGQRLRRESRLAISEIRRIAFEASGALHHAHEAGMVHRDIKPDNIMLEGDEQRVLVMDLGIARAAEAEGTALTGTGILLGTPDYMSPEQASEREVDRRSDVYALGVVVYQMLAGELPFKASTLQGLVVKLVTEEAPLVTLARPDCPADLAAVVARCLAKEPDDRFATAAQLTAAVRPDTAQPAASVFTSGIRAAITSAKAPTSPITSLRRALGLFVIGNSGLLAVDLLLNGSLDFAPVVAALSALPLASMYARLWTAGYAWRDIMRGHPDPASTPVNPVTGALTPVPRSGAFGVHGDSVQLVRSERAVIAGLVANMPRSEREQFPAIVAAADQVVARVRSVARQLSRLDHLSDEQSGSRTLESPRSLARSQDEIQVKRQAMTGELRMAETVMEALRVAVERASAMGIAQSRTDLEVALAKADECARSRT